jgi:hypothetical protein
VEKVERYKSKKGLLYGTVIEAMIDDFYSDRRLKMVAARVGCGSENLALALWDNRRSVRALLNDMESILQKQE